MVSKVGKVMKKELLDNRKLALVGIILNQILFSFNSDEDRRTDSRIRRKNSSRFGFIAQWLERATRIRKTLCSIPGGAALCFFVWSGCQFFYLCRSWKRREFELLDNVLGPKCRKSGLFSKARVSIRVKVRVRVSFSRCENVHFRRTRWCPRLGKGWKKNFWTTFWAQSVEKRDFFQKLGLVLGLGLAFQGGNRLHRRVGWILAWQIWSCMTRILSTNKDIMVEALTPTMEGHAVTVTDNHWHLGVVLSEDLKWSKHAQCILAAASKRAGLLRLMARDLPLPVASILYVYMYYVRPVLEYASPVWHGSLRVEDAMFLERIQASVARSLLQADWFTPKEELFRQLGWPALRWRREITSLTMFHKLLHSRPEPLSECLFQYASATSARSRRKTFQLLLPHTRTTRYRESFFYKSALLWNSPLPHDIQSLKNSKSFRDALENHYQTYKFTTTENFHIPLFSAFS